MTMDLPATHLFLDLLAACAYGATLVYVVRRMTRAERQLRTARARLGELSDREFEGPVRLFEELERHELKARIEALVDAIASAPCYGQELHGAPCPTANGRYCDLCVLRIQTTLAAPPRPTS